VSAYPQPFAVQAGEGEAVPTPTCDTVVVKADTHRTSGSMSVFELTVAPRSGPALHAHLRDDELWYVLEDEFRFEAGDGRRCWPRWAAPTGWTSWVRRSA
jgi:mannose-6-phosphate isomerase-like protein (cupin superfamily)